MDFLPIIRLIVTSDIHLKTDCETEVSRFQKGMRLASAYANSQTYKGIDAFLAVGDFANRGEMGQMLLFRSLLERCLPAQTPKILTLASHEFMDAGVDEAYKRFHEIFSRPTDTHTVINGFHLIALSTAPGCRIGDDKKEWLIDQLKNAAEDDPQKPIFVFQHPHLSDTVYGSINWGEDDIISVLMDYPQVIDFSGHSHAPINDPRSVHQRYFTCFGTGSFSYFELDEFHLLSGTVPPDAKECAQFLIVEADAQNRVLVKPYDILSESFFHEGTLIETPSCPETFVYTDERYRLAVPPRFSKDAKCEIAVKDQALTVTFDQALSVPERPDSYTVKVLNGKGQILKQVGVTSSYYLKNMPKRVTVCFPFDKKGSFTLRILAHGFWKNSSLPLDVDFEVK